MSIYPAFELYDVYNDQDILTTTDEINNSSGDSSFDSDLYVKKSGDTMYGQLVLPSINFVDGSNQSTGFTTTLKQDLTETKAKTQTVMVIHIMENILNLAFLSGFKLQVFI